MIQSKLILDIFDLIFDEIESEDLLRQQIQFLSEKSYEHTGIGMYVYFLADKEIEKYKIPTEKATNFDILGNPTEMINGVELSNEELNILADTTVHLKNGIIDCIEIWNKNGEDYPRDEPVCYELTQSWLEIPKRRRIKR